MYIGIDIGGTNIKIGIFTKLGRILASTSFKTRAPRPYEEIEKDIFDAINSLCQKESIDYNSIKGIGIGVPGMVNSKSGIVLRASNLGWVGIDLEKRFSKLSHKIVKIGNDANCAALAEQKFGGGKQYDDCVFITFGTGIGTGLIINGKIYDGYGGTAGECGHMVIVKDGEECACGNKGCWERYASASALTRRTEMMAKQNPQSKLNNIIAKYKNVSAVTAFEAARQNDEIGKQLVDKYIEYVSIGLINLIQILHPQAFIIGGGVSNEGKDFIQPLNHRVNKFVQDNNIYPQVEVKKAILGNTAGMIGAASLVMD